MLVSVIVVVVVVFVVVVVVIFIVGIVGIRFMWPVRITCIPQAKHELAIAAYSREVLAANNVAQTIQVRVVNAQLEQVRIVTHDELAMTALGHVFKLYGVVQQHGAHESTKRLESTHLRHIVITLVVMVEGDNALAVLQRQQEVKVGADVNCLELVCVKVQLLEWKLDVCVGQLAERHIAPKWPP